MKKNKTIIESLESYLSSEEGMKHARKYFQDIKTKDDIIESQIDRFYMKHHNEINGVIERIKTKYQSQAYIDKWRKRGFYDTPNRLYSYLLKYGAKYGRDATDDEFTRVANQFTAELYVIGDYYVELMVGQGSFISVFSYDSIKIDEK